MSTQNRDCKGADPLTPKFDLVGVGLNATDTLLLVPAFPAYGGKVRIAQEITSCGGQVASALATASKLGLQAKYIGTVGDDARGKLQLASLRETGIDLTDVEIRKNCANQSAYIVIDQSTGERTVFWSRPDCLTLDPSRISKANIGCARMLHIDGHDTPAVEQAARIARGLGIPVSCDVDTIYPGFDRVLPLVDYLISSTEFPARWTGEQDPYEALKKLPSRFAAMTLGAEGVLARDGAEFLYIPGFVVDCVDTTGAGDVFHGAFCYSVLNKMSMPEALEFACAMAALNCTQLGARGGIATAAEAAKLMKTGERRAWRR